MKLLVTNDDGIDSTFLLELVRALKDAGHSVFVVAPQSEQSWIGCAKSRHRTVTSTALPPLLGCPTWTVDGTPSDCVNIALAHLLPRSERIDAVVSGINIGRNASLGFILASGTIGGAWEGAIHGLPGIALSHDLSAEAFATIRVQGGQPDARILASVRTAAARAAMLLPELVATIPGPGFAVHNLNFPDPCGTDTPIVRTVPAHVVIPGLFSPAADDGTHRFVFHLGEDRSPAEPLTDRVALDTGRISHTILDYRVLGSAFVTPSPAAR